MPAGAEGALSLHTPPTVDSFEYARMLGEGSFSSVLLCRHKASGREFAVKMCNKEEMRKVKMVARLHRERDILARLDHPLIPKLFCCFTTTDDAFFVLSLARYGDISPVIQRLGGSLDMKCTTFYVAEVVLALEYIHSKHIIHRDLKPENILLRSDLHIYLTDFGTAKDLSAPPSPATPTRDHSSEGSGRRESFVGSPQFVSPEVLKNLDVGPACDYFALGSIIFQFLAGEAPFLDATEYLMFQKVLKLDYQFPPGFPLVAKDLVEKLLVFNPSERFGHENQGGAKAVKDHPFFSDINWDTLIESEPPKMRPFLPARGSSIGSGDDSGGGGGGGIYSDCVSSVVEEMQPAAPTWYSNPLDCVLHDEDKATAAEQSSKPVSTGTNRSQLQASGVDMSAEEHQRQLQRQKESTPWHVFARDRLILKSGLLDKRVGLFARRRMFLLLQGPHILYIDPKNRETKGEIAWSSSLKAELKDDKTFFIHVPNRVYYLQDPEGRARDWVQAITGVQALVSAAAAN